MLQNDKKYFVYLRQSKKDNSFHTFDVQLKGIENFARQNGIKLDLSDEYCRREEKSAYSGKRSSFGEMIDLLEADQARLPQNKIYEGIIFYNTSRISRNPHDFLRIENLMRAGYTMFSATENIIDSASGMYFFRMMQIESIYYSDRQSSKMQWYNLHILFRNPYKGLGGVGITYWYDINDNNIIIPHPINSKIVQRIFDLRWERMPHEEIHTIIKDEFTSKVRAYNKNYDGRLCGEITDEYSDEYMDNSLIGAEITSPEEEADYSFTKMNKKREEDMTGFRAYIPNAKKISEIVTDVWRIKYNGKRRYEFTLNFNEDARMQNEFIKSSITPFVFDTGDRFIKGENAITFNTPKLQIVSTEKYEPVVLWAIRRRHIKSEIGHVYNDILHCACGSEITAKLEWWNIYYRCLRASKKEGCHRTTRIPETRLDEFVEKEILSYLQPKKESAEFIALLGECKKSSIEHLKYRIRTANGNLTKFKSAINEIKNANLHQQYLEKIEKTEVEIEEMTDEMEILWETTQKQLLNFFTFTDDFHLLDRGTKKLMIEFIFERVEMDEIHEEGFIFINIFNRLKNIQYQKIISAVQLTPYLHELFIFNRYHDGL